METIKHISEIIPDVVSCIINRRPVPGATLFHITIDGCLLALTSSELRKGLREEMWDKGLRRGKGILRRQQFYERELKKENESVAQRGG